MYIFIKNMSYRRLLCTSSKIIIPLYRYRTESVLNKATTSIKSTDTDLSSLASEMGFGNTLDAIEFLNYDKYDNSQNITKE